MKHWTSIFFEVKFQYIPIWALFLAIQGLLLSERRQCLVLWLKI